MWSLILGFRQKEIVQRVILVLLCIASQSFFCLFAAIFWWFLLAKGIECRYFGTSVLASFLKPELLSLCTVRDWKPICLFLISIVIVLFFVSTDMIG